MLPKDKLLRTVPDKGAFVSKPGAAEAWEIFAVRRILETALAREFVERAKPADYKRIEQHLKLERKAAAGDDAQLRNRLLADFHTLLAEVVGNSVLTEMLRELSARSAIITICTNPAWMQPVHPKNTTLSCARPRTAMRRKRAASW
jgi:DNA-binding GntR family transcriptional regulator